MDGMVVENSKIVYALHDSMLENTNYFSLKVVRIVEIIQ